MCDSNDHLARDCKQSKTDSTVCPPWQGSKKTTSASTKMVHSGPSLQTSSNPPDYLYSTNSDEGEPQVEIQGVHAHGIINGGVEITIMWVQESCCHHPIEEETG